MCLIAVAPKGTKKYSEFLLEAVRKASVTNTDGIGFSYKRDKNKSRVWISKGFKDVEVFIKSLKNKRLKDEDELIIHLRIGNKGGKTTEMNHPFVLSDDTDIILSNETYVENSIMAHNGTFFDYSVHSSMLSDTYFFVKEFMSVKEIQDLLKRDLKLFKDTFKYVLKTNRLAFIFNDETPLVVIGDFKEDQGYFFSNDSYSRNNYRNIGGADYYGAEDYESERWHGRTTNFPRAAGFRIPERVEPITNLARIIENSERAQEELARLNAAVDNHTSEDGDDDDHTSITQLREHNARIGKIVEGNNLKSIGTRQRNGGGYLEANPAFDIFPTPNCKIIVDMNKKMPFYGFFNESIYVPRVYNYSQADEAKFVPRFFNYKHLLFLCTSLPPDNSDLKHLRAYQILEFDENKAGEHRIILEEDAMTNTHRDYIYVTTAELVKYFKIQPREAFTKVYHDVYRLIQKYDQVSKNNYAHTNRIIYKAENKKILTGLAYKGVSNLEILALKIYNNYLCEGLYDEEAVKQFYHRVQRQPVYVN